MKSNTLAMLAMLAAALAVPSADASRSSQYRKVNFSDTDGLTLATAIVITGAANEKQGVDCEYEWLDEHFPKWTLVSQGLDGDEDAPAIYDRMKIRLASGEETSIYFDITDFFGK